MSPSLIARRQSFDRIPRVPFALDAPFTVSYLGVNLAPSAHPF